MKEVYLIYDQSGRLTNWKKTSIYRSEKEVKDAIVRHENLANYFGNPTTDPDKFEIKKFVLAESFAGKSLMEEAAEEIAIGRYLDKKLKSRELAWFWNHLCTSGKSQQIAYVAQVEHMPGMSGKDRMKEIRAQIKGLGIKANQFKMRDGCVGFYSDDDAMNASLCCTFTTFVNIQDVKAEIKSGQ